MNIVRRNQSNIPQPNQIERPSTSNRRLQLSPQNIDQQAQYQKANVINSQPSSSRPHPQISMVQAPIARQELSRKQNVNLSELAEMSKFPDSIEYKKTINLHPLFTSLPNPEMEEEFSFQNLGIDLQTTEPLLPNVYYVGSDNPMVLCGQFPSSHNYPVTSSENEKDDNSNSALQRISKFSTELLIFIFNVYTRDELQLSAYNELVSRGLTFDERKLLWINKNGFAFDIERWRFVRLDEFGFAPIK